MTFSSIIPTLGAIAFLGFATPGFACAMGGVPAHNMAHDGTATCVTCTCAHHDPEHPEPDEVTELDEDQHLHGHDHAHDPVAEPHPTHALRRFAQPRASTGAILAACRTYKVICGQNCTNRRVKNGGVWITVRDCQPRYCDHTTCN